MHGSLDKIESIYKEGAGEGRVGLGFYQLRTAAASKWFFRAILKDASDPHSFMAFGKAFHMFVV